MSKLAVFAVDLPPGLEWWVVLVVFVAIFAFSTLLLVVNRYKR